MVKNPPASTGDGRDAGSISGPGKYPERGHGNPLQYSCLEQPHGQRLGGLVVHRVTESETSVGLSTHTDTKM